MKTVLVTGASGFIGRFALGPLKRRGYAVHALTRGSGASFQADGVEWHRADLMDRAEMRKLITSIRPRHLLHLAWNTKHGEFWQAADNLDWAAASLDLLRCFVEHGGSRFVGAGTCAEYQWGAGECDELQTPLRPASLYGSAKKAVYEVLAAYAPSRDLSWAWGRVFFLFGPGEQESRLVPYLIQNCLKRQRAVCRFGQLRRDFLYVEDVADAFAALLDSEVSGAVNIASGQTVQLRQFARVIARSCGDPNLIEVREDAPAPGEQLEISADVRRLREEVRWVPKRDVESDLAQTIEWWRAKLHVPSATQTDTRRPPDTATAGETS